MKTTPFLALLAALGLSVTPASAGVYKYQDENGKWHFTDKPPKNEGAATVVTTSSAKKIKSDLQADLHDEFNPATEVDRATLAVVTVSVGGGSGSGFFVTDDGYLVTNRHVVRPASSTSWKEHESKLAERKESLDQFKNRLREEERRLREMKMTIDEDREYFESNQATDIQRSQYQRYIDRYKRGKEKYEKAKRKHRKQAREYKSAKSEFGFSSSMSNFSRKFTITLKDGTELKAKLVRISKNHDLALLKLDHYRTPFLPLAGQSYPRQGTRVYAIGSPLGITDSLTSGIVTKTGGELLLTDTRILPGNSGGPLIDVDGKVLGVNTAVVAQQKVSSGLGLAIYSKHIREEFARELGGKI